MPIGGGIWLIWCFERPARRSCVGVNACCVPVLTRPEFRRRQLRQLRSLTSPNHLSKNQSNWCKR